MRRGRGRVRMEELPRRLSLSTTGKSGSSRLLTLAVWLRYLQYCRYRQQQYLWLWREYSGTSRKPAWAVYDFLFPFPVPVGRRPPGGGFASRKFYGLWLWLSPSRATGLRLLLHNNASIRVDRVSLIDYSMYCMYCTVRYNARGVSGRTPSEIMFIGVWVIDGQLHCIERLQEHADLNRYG